MPRSRAGLANVARPKGQAHDPPAVTIRMPPHPRRGPPRGDGRRSAALPRHGPPAHGAGPNPGPGAGAARAAATPAAPPAAPKVSKQSPAAEYTPTVRFRLRTELAEGKMAFVGVGGDIEGVVNPTLRVAEGDVVQVEPDQRGRRRARRGAFPDFKAATDRVNRKGASSVTVFRADQAASSRTSARCPGTARRAWKARSSWAAARPRSAALPPSVSIVRDPADLPGPLPAGAAADGGGRAGGGGAGRQARERHDVHLLDLQRQGAGPVPPRAGRRHRRGDASRTATRAA